MKRLLFGIAALVCGLAGYFSVQFYVATGADFNRNVVLGIVVPVCLLLLALACVLWIFEDVLHHVHKGVVIDHAFVDRHFVSTQVIRGVPAAPAIAGTQTTVIPEHWAQAEWSIQIQDSRGHKTWVHFPTNVFGQYPIDSTYPAARSLRRDHVEEKA